VFETFLLSVIEYFGASWSEYQLREAAEMLFGEYHYWTVQELKLFSVRIKTGKFGKMYGKISPAEIMNYAIEFNSELLQNRADKNKQKQPGDIEEEGKYVDSRLVIEALKDLVTKMNERVMEAEKAFEEKREQQRKETAKAREELIRSYCEKNNLDFEKVKKQYS